MLLCCVLRAINRVYFLIHWSTFHIDFGVRVHYFVSGVTEKKKETQTCQL